MRVLARILAVLTAAATVIGLMAVYLHCVDLKESHKKFREWEKEQEEFEAW